MFVSVMKVFEERLPCSEFYFREIQNFKNRAELHVDAIASPKLISSFNPKWLKCNTESSDVQLEECGSPAFLVKNNKMLKVFQAKKKWEES